jgi:hypothetical protein
MQIDDCVQCTKVKRLKRRQKWSVCGVVAGVANVATVTAEVCFDWIIWCTEAFLDVFVCVLKEYLRS